MTTPLERLTTALADRYAIESEIGAGGMATVYLAHDLKHDRKVAVKVLRPDIAATLGADRFLREVHIAANLTHPHVLGLHDSGEADGFLYYVMPFIEGESLRERIDREGELPVHDAIKIIKEIVDALAHAHAHNVVHRDIKPDNVLISGRHAMVTDFGVAKAISEATGRDKLTTAGVALGTPSYMAPEQAAAEPHIDHRADIYAVGIVAYELLTGQLPFTGTTQQQLLAAHITEVPRPPSTLRPALSASIDQFVLKCLEKRPSDRWQTAEEMLPVLEGLSTPTGGVTPTATAPVSAVAPAPTRSLRVPVLTGVVVALAIVGFLGWSSMRSGQPSVTISNTRQLTRAPEVEFLPALSPDGGEVAYSAGSGREWHVFVQDLGGGRAFPLTVDRPGTQIMPSWTPDGGNVTFVEMDEFDFPIGTQLIPRLGGRTRTVSPGWGWDIHEDRVVFQLSDSIFVQPLDGGDRILLVVASPEPHSVRWSPDGSKLVFVQGNRQFNEPDALGNIAPSSIWVVDIEDGEPIRITDHPSLNVSPIWTPDGRHLLFVSNRDGARDLYIVRIDGAGRARGDPVRVTTGLDAHSISLSADGSTAVYSKFTFRRNLWQVPIPVTGAASMSEATPLTFDNQVIELYGVSRDGGSLTFDSNVEGSQDIYVMPIEGGEPQRVTSDPADEFSPDFSPDASEITFHSPRDGSRDVFIASVAGGGQIRLTNLPGEEYHPTFSPDGLQIAFGYFDRVGSAAFTYFLTREAMGEPWSEPVLFGPGFAPRWSPDGTRIVSQDAEGIRVQRIDGEPQRLVDVQATDLTAARWPDWSLDGRLVYFSGTDASGASAIYAVPAAGGQPREVVRFDDPTRIPFDLIFAVGNGRFYVSIADYESDLWVMDIELP